MYTLPIEHNKDLLLQYGRAFAWINLVDNALTGLIVYKLIKEEEVWEFSKKVSKKMMGKKIELLKPVVEEALYSKLSELNERRIKLAHGVTDTIDEMSEGADLSLINIRIYFDGKLENFTVEFLNETCVLCDDTMGLMRPYFN